MTVRRLVVVALAQWALSGCATLTIERHATGERRVVREAPVKVIADPMLFVAAANLARAGDELVVTVSETRLCRRIDSSVVVERLREERHIGGVGWYAEWVMLGGGIATVAVIGPDVEGLEAALFAAGIIGIGVGGSCVLADWIRGIDRTRDGPEWIEERDAGVIACGAGPSKGRRVRLVRPNGTFVGASTDKAGHVRLRLPGVDAAVRSAGLGRLTVDGRDIGRVEVDERGVPSIAR